MVSSSTKFERTTIGSPPDTIVSVKTSTTPGSLICNVIVTTDDHDWQMVSL